MARRRRALAIMWLIVLAIAAPASAARPPSLAERSAVTAVLPQWIRAYPVGCMWLDITVANGGGYAKVTPVYLHPLKAACAKYTVGNGYWIFKRGTQWREIYEGSELPACKLHIPRDLSRCSA